MTAAALTSPAAVARTVTTVRVDAGELLELLPAEGALSWVRHGEGLVGWGEAARLEVTGPNALAEAAAWWAEYTADLAVDDDLAVPGSGPVLFGSIAFDPLAGTSVFVVPEVTVGRRDGVGWVTTVGDVDLHAVTPVDLPDDEPALRLRYADNSRPVLRSRSSGVAPSNPSTANVQQSGTRAASRRSSRRGSRGASAETSRSRANTTLASSPAPIRSTAVATAAHHVAGSRAPSA